MLRRTMLRSAARPASSFKDEKDPAYLEFQSTAAIQNLYEFQVKNVAQYNVELRKLADLKVNDTLKSTFEVMKSKLIRPDANTIEILMKSAEPANHKRSIHLFDDVLNFELDPTAETYKTMSGIMKAAKQEKAATLLTSMAKDEDKFGTPRMYELTDEFKKIASAKTA
eukprot:TRINITY_DN38759_c0_g1_i1.p2 TRINITY_DN38759_c0_g1~~TRINITY_DN38759_c0_g1_i1.p2  ORF type:complete len:168 (+),score=55.08 TRINITY_DN38759_c0_g1_i1:53-556(+)